MKRTSLALFLFGIACFSVVGQVATPKNPNFVICEADRVVLYPSDVAVSMADLKSPGNALEKLLDKVQADRTSEFMVVFARPKSVKSYRMIRMMIAQRPVDVGYDVLDADEKPTWRPSLPKPEKGCIQAIPGPAGQARAVKAGCFRAMPHAVPSNKWAVFVECRQNEVFFVDKENLDAQVEKLLASIPPDVRRGDLKGFMKAIRAQEIGNESYTVNPNYLLTAIIAVEARPGVHGNAVDTLDKADGKFQKALSQLKPDERFIAFMVRDDSFPAFRKARAEAEKLGFDTGWELLGEGEPMKFGAGGSAISVQ